jgi:ABC-type sugar transport system ATPase subunit
MLASPVAEVAVHGLSKSFPGTRALEGLTLDLQGGEIHAIVGENGAGKSTLLMILAGVHQPDAGKILLRGEEVSFGGPSDAIAAGIGTVFQELSLVEGLSVAENVFAGRAPTRGPGLVDNGSMRERTGALLRRLGSDLPAERGVASLGTGERQMVEIAKALSLDARVLLLDEPTSALTAEEGAAALSLLRRLSGEGIAIAFVSHRLPEVFRIADRITVLRDGKLVETTPRAETDPDRVVRSMVGRVLSDLYPGRAEVTGPPLLELKGACTGRVGPIDLQVHAGEIVGLAGLRGSGRSRLARAVFGAGSLDAGEIAVAGRTLRPGRPWRAARAGVAFVPSDRQGEGVFPRMSLSANLVASTLPAVSRHGLVSAARQRRVTERLVQELGVRARSLSQPVHELSGGNQQKVMLARWLAADAKVLVIDEPTQGIDVGAKAELHRTLRRLADEGRAVLMVSSDLPEVLGMCDRIAVMANGRLRAILDGASATEEQVMSLAAEVAA